MSREELLKELRLKQEDIKNLDDMAAYFFQVARDIDHPLQRVELELTDSWGEQSHTKG